jgi:hypothetical protein
VIALSAVSPHTKPPAQSIRVEGSHVAPSVAANRLENVTHFDDAPSHDNAGAHGGSAGCPQPAPARPGATHCFVSVAQMSPSVQSPLLAQVVPVVPSFVHLPGHDAPALQEAPATHSELIAQSPPTATVPTSTPGQIAPNRCTRSPQPAFRTIERHASTFVAS